MQINSLLLPLLQKINFANRHKTLALKYQLFDQRLTSFQIDEATRIIKSFGYPVNYNKSESFFKISEKVLEYQIQFNVSLKGGVVEFMYGVIKNGERLKIGSSVCTTIEMLLDEDFKTKPVFHNYDDLREILREAFDIYEDFKRGLLQAKENEK